MPMRAASIAIQAPSFAMRATSIAMEVPSVAMRAASSRCEPSLSRPELRRARCKLDLSRHYLDPSRCGLRLSRWERRRSEAVAEARSAASQSTAALHASAKAQRDAYGNLAGHVNTVADGSDTFILSTGYEVRATPTPRPPLTEAPSDVRTRINGVPENVLLLWKGLSGARNYEVQYTTDLSGVTGWINVPETPGATRLNVEGLVSGTKYAFRVRGLSTGQPGPWSIPVPQMAP
jgi:hypothetical protein